MARRVDAGEETVTAMDRHRRHVKMLERDWGPQEPKRRNQCAFPLCEAPKASNGGGWCSGHKKQKQRGGVENMSPLGTTHARHESWLMFKERYPKAKDTPWKCAWVGCRKRSLTKNALHCASHDYKWRKYRKDAVEPVCGECGGPSSENAKYILGLPLCAACFKRLGDEEFGEPKCAKGGAR